MKERTYQDYKELFEEVNKRLENNDLHYCYILLFSFLEDRVNKVFTIQPKIFYGKDNLKVKEKIQRASLFVKLDYIERWGIKIPMSKKTIISNLNKIRNQIVHNALFNFNDKFITKKNVDDLYDLCRCINRVRERQKKDPKLLQVDMDRRSNLEKQRKELRRKLRLNFHGDFPKRYTTS